MCTLNTVKFLLVIFFLLFCDIVSVMDVLQEMKNSERNLANKLKAFFDQLAQRVRINDFWRLLLCANKGLLTCRQNYE